MKKSLLSAILVGAMTAAALAPSVAFAGPKRLTVAEMDGVTAGNWRNWSRTQSNVNITNQIAIANSIALGICVICFGAGNGTALSTAVAFNLNGTVQSND